MSGCSRTNQETGLLSSPGPHTEYRVVALRRRRLGSPRAAAFSESLADAHPRAARACFGHGVHDAPVASRGPRGRVPAVAVVDFDLVVAAAALDYVAVVGVSIGKYEVVTPRSAGNAAAATRGTSITTRVTNIINLRMHLLSWSPWGLTTLLLRRDPNTNNPLQEHATPGWINT